jgi:membrane-associated phospholipid phosphatase
MKDVPENRPRRFNTWGVTQASGGRHLITPLSWWSLGVFAVVDVIWLAISPLTFVPSHPWMFAQAVLPIGLNLCVYPLTLSCLKGDSSRIASALRGGSYGVDVLARAGAFTVCWGIAGGTYMYLATSAALPLLDTRLAALDEALGFDWLAFLAFANSSPMVSWALVTAYHSALPQMLALYLLLAFSGRERRLGEFLALMSITWVAVGALMLIVPAAGAYAHFRPPLELFDGFSANAGMWHYETLMRLREQAAPVVEFSQMVGLVTFPSFHTVLAIITAYSFRGIRFFAWPAAVLNAVVIVSTLPEGGHYLVDVIAGVVIAVIGILLVRWEQSRWRRAESAGHQLNGSER